MKMTEFSKFSSINIGLITSFTVIVLILNTVSSRGDVTLTVAKEDASSVRSRFSLPRLFNFEYFKGIFNKAYGSVLENLVRKRLYLGRTFRAFITAVGYKHCKINYYLGINQMSDWTLEEQKATLMSSNFFNNDDIDFDEGENDDVFSEIDEDNHQQTEDELPVADLEDIKEKFEEIADHENEKPGYKEIAKELKDNILRYKRDVDDVRENFSVKDLIKVFEGAGSTQKVGTVKSEEPDRTFKESSPAEKPKLVITSPQQDQPQQVSVEKEVKNLPVKEAEIIAKQPDEPFLKTVISVATSMFSKQKSAGKASEKKRQDKIYHDYRKSECYLPLKDQKGCACCYAFAAIAMYEWVYCSETGKPLAFSEQYPIDCGQDVGLDGCKAAKYDTLSNFTVKYGLEPLNNYPYIGKGGKCPYNKQETLPEAMGYLRFVDKGWFHVPIKKFEDQLKRTPIVVNMLVTDKIHDYGGGVDDGSYCDQDYKHSALLIGSGRQDGEEYWLFRFAYSDAYGEGGHYKLNKKSKCLARCGSVLKANFGRSPDESLNSKYYSEPVKELKREYSS